MLDRWLSYTVTIVRKFTWADPALIVLDEWSSYGGGRLNRFDCILLYGSSLFSQNQSILNSSIKHIIDSNHFSGSIF